MSDQGGDRFAYAPETKANAILFQEMCDKVLEKMPSKISINDKLELLGPFLSKVGRESAFPFMRLILPELDNLRDKYGVKTMKLAKLIAQMYFPDRSSKQYQQLVLHTDPVKNPSPAKEWQITGDFPLTLQYILQTSASLHVVEKTTWTLEQVNKTLDDLARAGSDTVRAEVLRRIRVDCSAINQKWIMRIILKNLKIKLKKDSVLKKIHPDALEEYSRTTSLRKVCSTFIGLHNSVRLKSSLEVFTSFSPMLAANLFYNMDKIVPRMMGRPFCMDVKLDGERMLCHLEGGKIKWFTRNAKDYSERYGPLLDPHVLEGVSVHKCILDGEVVSWDDETGSMVPFGHNRACAKEEAEGVGSGTRWLFYVVFDIVYAAGEGPEGEQRMTDILRDAAGESCAPCPPGIVLKGGNLTALPLDVRRRVLRSVLMEKKHRLEFVKSRDVEAGDEAKREEQLSAFFELNAIQLGEEGLVVKTLDGHYEIGDKSRKTCLWVKMKPEYSDQTADLDLIILGAGFAHGRMRSGLLSKFLVGVAVPTADGSPPTKFFPITRVGTGFTLEELEALNKRLEGKWKTFDTDPPHFPVRGSTRKSLTGRDGVQISRWIAPEDSICLEVKSMEIKKSGDWAVLGCTLRFPRVTRIRYDKGAEGCLDTTQLAEMQVNPRRVASTGQGGYGANGADGVDGKRRKREFGKGRRKGGGRTVSGLFATEGESGVAVTEDVFVTNGKPLEMCVIGNRFLKTPIVTEKTIDVDAWWDGSVRSKRKAVDESEVLGRRQMGDLIREYGGIPTAHPQESTAFVIVGDNSVQVQHVIADNSYNVVDYRWLFECIDRKAYDFPSMHYLRATSPQIKKVLENYKDEYGDDFTAPTDAEELSQLLLNIRPPAQGAEGRDLTWLLPLNDMDAEDRAALMDNPEFLFADKSRCLVYCDLYPDLGSTDPPGKANSCGHGEASTRKEISFHLLGSTVAAIRLHGGDVAPFLHVGVTHVVLDPNDATRHVLIRDRIRELHKRSDSVFHVRLVTPEWAWRCIELGRLEPPLDEHVITLA